MNIDALRPVLRVLTNRYSWLAIGMAFGHFGLGALSPEWKALVDLGTAGAVALLALFPEKGQLGRAEKGARNDDANSVDSDVADPAERLRDNAVGMSTERQAGSDGASSHAWFDNR